MTKGEIDELFQHNVSQFSQMERDAGNMVKQLLWELQAGDFNTYIRLRDPQSGGSVIHYDMVQGNTDLVQQYAKVLGFTSWDSEKLAV